ncbi:hypothetical protein HK097_011403 [Rhizophlyctis rosea]|uniref:Uncharacterized protein n=1 Tax=Rhizophlyctis rosea TaxID=64517 RepID=A0AAD5S6D5_9FUNG|nr:hypothetical protein HK097_011403 [Rhizophlyctis rosea]
MTNSQPVSVGTDQDTIPRAATPKIDPKDAGADLDIDAVLDDYPIILANKTRQGVFEPPPKWWPWWEKSFFGPARRNLAKYTSQGWLDSRFRTSPADPPYMPDQFLLGAPFALSAFLSTLGTWDGRDPTHPIHSLAKSTLLDKFAASHSLLARQGHTVTLSVSKTKSDPEVKDIFISFGPESVIQSTLTEGTVLKRYNPNSFVKASKEGRGKHGYLIFREVTFEYALKEKDVEGWEDQMPGLGPRARSMQTGAVVGVDVSCDVELKVEVRKGGDEGRLGTLVTSEKVDKVLEFRLESDHFEGKKVSPEGFWRVADVDRLLISDRVREEEKWFDRQE